ncbi:porin [Lichenibacterium dinghuense]|uniref:porin n=1 Tax=Lichenibacterium dinghuense TaxID=2895977 RepID=UPI001F18A703|nr:porin [Lichenibacterium sp. 6Y81]
MLAASAGAQAADLPVRKAAPVDYVRVCDWTGIGFFYIPGTDTCIQVGGLVRVEAAFINQSRQFFPSAAPLQATGAAVNVGNRAAVGPGTIIAGRNEDESGFFVRGRIAVDTRTQTAYGTLRAYVRYQIDRLQGLFSGGGAAGGANTFANQGNNNAYLDKGFITFAGITAGRVQSFFDFYADNYNYEGIANSDQSNNVLAYTYSAGGGLSATFSLEDHNARNLNSLGGVGIGNADNSAVNPTVFAGATYGGETIPDLVGQLRVDQAWGAAQLSAAYHQVNTVSGPFGTNGGVTHKDADGFAVQGGVQLKLPMLAAGDDLWIEGAYEQGAYSYIDSVSYANAGFASRNLGGFQHIDHDAIAIAIPGNTIGNYGLQLGEGFSVMAAINHYFTATFHDVLFGSYIQTNYGRARNIDWTQGGLGNSSVYRVGNQFLYDPVKNLEIGLEFDYAHLDQTLAHNPGMAASALPIGITKDPDMFEAHLRIERDF